MTPDCLVMTADRAKPLIDENTIGVACMFASTYNGEFEDVKAIHDMVVSQLEVVVSVHHMLAPHSIRLAVALAAAASKQLL